VLGDWHAAFDAHANALLWFGILAEQSLQERHIASTPL